jgi:hypothetical protein
MSYPHWDYFILLESDLAATSRFVEFSANNYKTYSTEFVKIFLAGCSEIDVVAKLLCQQINSTAKCDNVIDYQNIISGQYPKFHTVEVTVPWYSLKLEPWKDWGSGTTPVWWKAHNRVKHQRSNYFNEANLENVLLSMSALFALVLYFYHQDLQSGYFGPVLKLLSMDGPQVIWDNRRWKLPDF